jgi:hypothetical protein
MPSPKGGRLFAGEEIVCVPRWALEYVRTRAHFDDDGPSHAGWPSPEMERARAAIDAALAAKR